MSWLEFTTQMIDAVLKYLSWPVAISFIIFFLKNEVATVFSRLMAITYKGIRVDFAETTKKMISGNLSEFEIQRLKERLIVGQGQYYRLYSNGLLIEKFKITLFPSERERLVIYPLTFPNEVISVQVIGNTDARVERAGNGNCNIVFSPVASEQEIEFIVSGF